MTVTQSLLAFTLAADLLTVTPGLDTALVLRAAAARRAAGGAMAAAGIALGCLLWGAVVALGLGALLPHRKPPMACSSSPARPISSSSA